MILLRFTSWVGGFVSANGRLFLFTAIATAIAPGNVVVLGTACCLLPIASGVVMGGKVGSCSLPLGWSEGRSFSVLLKADFPNENIPFRKDLYGDIPRNL